MSAPVELFACVTCGGALRDEHGRTQGERLLEKLRTLRDERAHAKVRVDGVRCLWACKQSCSVHIRSRGRVSYVLAQFDDGDDSARGLLDYAALYGESPDGAVSFKQWPQAVRGHFVCRLPPTEDVPASED